jgi:hypothetical protein
MAKVNRKNPVAEKRASVINMSSLLARVSKRISLPNVPMRVCYQDDVDTLSIQFEGDVSSTLVSEDDEFENGVIGIYKGRKLIGLEILDISGQFECVNPV